MLKKALTYLICFTLSFHSIALDLSISEHNLLAELGVDEGDIEEGGDALQSRVDELLSGQENSGETLMSESSGEDDDAIKDLLKGVLLSELGETTEEDVPKRLENKAKNSLKNRAMEEFDEVKGEVEKESVIIEKAIMDEAVPGMALSALSLLAVTMVAPVIGVVCYGSYSRLPSIPMYLGGAALYLTRELSSWKKFKIGTMLEMEKVEKLTIAEDDTLANSVDKASTYGNEQIKYLEAQLRLLKNGLKSIKSKGKNAKFAGVIFTASAVAAGIETYTGFLSGGGNCNAHNSPKGEQETFYASIEGLEINDEDSSDVAYMKFVETLDWSEGKNQSPDLDFYDKVKKDFEFFKGSGKHLAMGLSFILDSLISRAHAGNKEFDYAGDIDKLGIVLGGVISASVAIAIYKGHLTSVKKLAQFGHTRVVLFGGSAALALTAGTKLKKASEIFLARIEAVEGLLEKAKTRFYDVVSSANKVLKSSGQITARLREIGIPVDKNISQMNRSELEELVREVKARRKEIKERLKEEAEKVNEEEILEEIKESSGVYNDSRRSFIYRFLNLIFPSAHAGDCFVDKGRLGLHLDESCQCRRKKNCAKLSYGINSSRSFKSLISVSQDLQASGTYFYNGLEKKSDFHLEKIMNSSEKLKKADKKIKKMINSKLVKNGKGPIDFKGKEESFVKRFTRSIASIMKKHAGELKVSLNDQNHIAKKEIVKEAKEKKESSGIKERSGKLSMLQVQMLKKIRDKILLSKKRKSYKHDSLIKTREKSLFEVISRRYKIYYKDFY